MVFPTFSKYCNSIFQCGTVDFRVCCNLFIQTLTLLRNEFKTRITCLNEFHIFYLKRIFYVMFIRLNTRKYFLTQRYMIYIVWSRKRPYIFNDLKKCEHTLPLFHYIICFLFLECDECINSRGINPFKIDNSGVWSMKYWLYISDAFQFSSRPLCIIQPHNQLHLSRICV